MSEWMNNMSHCLGIYVCERMNDMSHCLGILGLSMDVYVQLCRYISLRIDVRYENYDSIFFLKIFTSALALKNR